MADALTSELLPQGYYAEEHVHVGGQVEVDVELLKGDRLVSTPDMAQWDCSLATRAWHTSGDIGDAGTFSRQLGGARVQSRGGPTWWSGRVGQPRQQRPR